MVLIALPAHFLFHGKFVYSFINGRRFLYDWHFFLFHLETAGCGVNNTFVKMIFVHNIMGNYYILLVITSDFWYCFLLFFYVCLWIPLKHSTPTCVASVCVYLLSGNSHCFFLHV
jgi:hypothetical protein